MFLRPYFVSGARRPHLDRFYIERIQKARLYTDRTFHSLVSLQRLATWGLGPIPSTEALAHEITTRRRKLFLFVIPLLFFYLLLLYIYIYIFKKKKKTDVFPFRNGDDEGEQGQGGCGRGS